jgi:hypothetical protein
METYEQQHILQAEVFAYYQTKAAMAVMETRH